MVKKKDKRKKILNSILLLTKINKVIKRRKKTMNKLKSPHDTIWVHN